MADHRISHDPTPFASLHGGGPGLTGRGRGHVNWFAITALLFCALCWSVAVAVLTHLA